MKCPYCGSSFAGKQQYCPSCKQPVSRAGSEDVEQDRLPEEQRHAHPHRTPVQVTMIVIATLILLLVLVLGIYKLTFSIYHYQITRLYTRSEYTPTIQETTMDDGRKGHSFVFYGEDGDQIFLPELNRSLPISGGVARVTVADADWFEGDVLDVEGAHIHLTPVLIDERGKRTQLPGIQFTIEVPVSPLNVISPAKDDLKVVTSRYLLELQVVPGSTVLVNGEDVTDTVDRNGLLSKNVNVYPVGENQYSVIVRTDKHHETRHDIIIYREAFDFNFELDSSVGNSSNKNTMTISGLVEPGAQLKVETEYVENSLMVDNETGEFQFIALLPDFGDNNVRFTASMEGKQDATISMVVEYKPTLAEYSSLAWKMDYSGLRRLYEQWVGQVFLCEGPLVDAYEQDGKQWLVMDVSESGNAQEYLLLENKTSTANPSLGISYKIYAEVSGRMMYNSQYYPTLTARYLDLAAD